MGMQLLKPGGFHIMLIGLTNELKSGDTFDITLTFANAGEITVTVPVR
jgi:copper(I)-binding protein